MEGTSEKYLRPRRRPCLLVSKKAVPVGAVMLDIINAGGPGGSMNHNVLSNHQRGGNSQGSSALLRGEPVQRQVPEPLAGARLASGVEGTSPPPFSPEGERKRGRS